MSYKTDFHIHTCYSDGSLTPAETVRRYKDEGYDMIAITDHDTVEGVREGLIAGETLNFHVVSGIEFSAALEDGPELHILGYYIDIENKELNERLEALRSTRKERNKRLLDYLRTQGYELSYDDLTFGKKGDYAGKPDFGRAMARKGYISSPKEIFAKGKYLDLPAARAIKKVKIDAVEAIGLINAAGGIAVMAHPVQIKGQGDPDSEEFYHNIEALVVRLKKVGLKGIECYHPDHSHEQALRFVEIAGKYHMHITEGSDFHGPDF